MNINIPYSNYCKLTEMLEYDEPFFFEEINGQRKEAFSLCFGIKEGDDFNILKVINFDDPLCYSEQTRINLTPDKELIGELVEHFLCSEGQAMEQIMIHGCQYNALIRVHTHPFEEGDPNYEYSTRFSSVDDQSDKEYAKFCGSEISYASVMINADGGILARTYNYARNGRITGPTYITPNITADETINFYTENTPQAMPSIKRMLDFGKRSKDFFAGVVNKVSDFFSKVINVTTRNNNDNRDI